MKSTSRSAERRSRIRAATFMGRVVFAAAFLVAAQDARAWEERNVDLPGSDYAAFCVANLSNVERCRSLCLAQPQCKAYTVIEGFGDKNVPAWMNNCVQSRMYSACFLKSAVPEKVYKSAYGLLRYHSGAKDTRTRQGTTPRGCQWGNSITRPGQRACFCWEGSYQVERPIHVCQGN